MQFCYRLAVVEKPMMIRSMNFATLAFLIAWVFVSPCSVAQVPGDAVPENRSNDVAPAEALITRTGADPIEIVIPTTNGRIVWKDVASSLAESLTLDAATVERIFPRGSLDLRSGATALALLGIDVALGDAVSLGMVRDQNGQPALRLTADRNAIRFLTSRHQPKTASIEIDPDWKHKSLKRPLVVCLHGLKSEPDRFDAFRSFLRKSGYATAAISYDDHQSMVVSAGQLSEMARQFFTEPHEPELVLVGHSMGGLVAREWAENESLNNVKVVALITAGSPHSGSNWATLPPLLDLFAERKLDAGDVVDVLLHQPSSPGMRELAPGSKFLRTLNSRPRRADVEYTAIVGSRSPMTTEQLNRIRDTLRDARENSGLLRLLEPRIQPLLQSFDELERGKGDGIVAINRAKMAGVEDVVEVDICHTDYFRAPVGTQSQPVWEAVLERLNAR